MECKDFYAIAALANFTLPGRSEAAVLPFCSFMKITEDQLYNQNKWFYESSYHDQRDYVAPSPIELRMVGEKKPYFICFESEADFRGWFKFINIALRLFDKFPTMTGKVLSKDEVSGDFGIFKKLKARGKRIDIPQYYIPKEFHSVAEKERLGEAYLHDRLFPKYNQWWIREYPTLCWREEYRESFTNLIKMLKTLYEDKKNLVTLEFLKLVIWNYYMIQDYEIWAPGGADIWPMKIVTSCMILENLCMLNRDKRGKSQELGERVSSLLTDDVKTDDVKERRRLRKLIIKCYDYRNDILHGKANKPEPSENIKYEFFDMPRLLIKFFLKKCIEEKLTRDQILATASHSIGGRVKLV